jgi:hypothetical protein
MIAEVNHRPLDDVPSLTDNKAKASIAIKECQAISPDVIIDATLQDTRNLPLPDPSPNKQRLYPQAFSDNRRVHAEASFSNSTMHASDPAATRATPLRG